MFSEDTDHTGPRRGCLWTQLFSGHIPATPASWPPALVAQGGPPPGGGKDLSLLHGQTRPCGAQIEASLEVGRCRVHPAP